jgi:hypothetical protein
MTEKIVRIGGASGFWGDSVAGAVQLVQLAKVDFLILDYLAEITMSVMARARRRNADAGYASDFVDVVMDRLIADIERRNIRVVTNAGGLNPAACARAMRAMAARHGICLKIATVEGDDMMPTIGQWGVNGYTEMFSGDPMPDNVWTANAYLGAFPIAAALDAGADIVITGRVVDSALALGPLIHEFGWTDVDYDRIAAGSLVGHIIECGAQATGGIHTDWKDVADWHNIGYPIAECRQDGSFILTKPEQTGGLVNPAVVAEQLIYEIGDPADYQLPDVVCDFTQVAITQAGPNRVHVSGAKGRAPSAAYKVSVTYMDGYRCSGGFTIIGRDAVAKARRSAETVIARVENELRASNLGDLTEVETEILGAETIYGDRSRAQESREVVLRVSAKHPDEAALKILAREFAPLGTGGAPGTVGMSGGRPKPQAVVRLFSFLLPKAEAPECRITLENQSILWHPSTSAVWASPNVGDRVLAPPEPEIHDSTGDFVERPLIALAVARSGDKGDKANIGVIARDRRYLPLFAEQLTADAVQAWLGHLVDGPTRRYFLPGIGAYNFVIDNALGGGGVASLRNDSQGKCYAQLLLDLPIRIPADWQDTIPQ